MKDNKSLSLDLTPFTHSQNKGRHFKKRFVFPDLMRHFGLTNSENNIENEALVTLLASNTPESREGHFIDEEIKK